MRERPVHKTQQTAWEKSIASRARGRREAMPRGHAQLPAPRFLPAQPSARPTGSQPRPSRHEVSTALHRSALRGAAQNCLTPRRAALHAHDCAALHATPDPAQRNPALRTRPKPAPRRAAPWTQPNPVLRCTQHSTQLCAAPHATLDPTLRCAQTDRAASAASGPACGTPGLCTGGRKASRCGEVGCVQMCDFCTACGCARMSFCVRGRRGGGAARAGGQEGGTMRQCDKSRDTAWEGAR